jgi:amino acid adenylation domain-containing protein
MSSKKRIEKVYPLSPMQAGMLVHALRDETSRAYFEQTVLKINGEIDLNVLEQSFNLLFERYDILRTVFRVDQLKEPLQFVLKHRNFTLQVEDLTDLNELEADNFIQKFTRKDRERGFDLGKDILMRVSLFKTASNAYTLVWNFHHILMDGWCLGIIYKELLLAYGALKQGKPADAGLQPVTPYARYIQWLGQQDKEEGLSYWEKYLEGYEHQAGLPKTNSNHLMEEIGYQLQTHTIVIDERKTSALNTTARKNQVTVNTLIQTIWGILLQKYNNCHDVVFGAVVSGRPPEIQGIENMVGLFINTIPVRIKTWGDESFERLLKRVRERAVLSRTYEYLSLAEIQSKSILKGNLIDHIMAFQNYPFDQQIKNISMEMKQKQESGIHFEIVDVKPHEQTNYNFNLRAAPGKCLRIKFDYNAFVYEKDFIKKLGLHFKVLTNQVLDNPGILIRDIGILAGEEKRRILFDFNDTRMIYPAFKTIDELFGEEVKQNPDQPAVTSYLNLADIYEKAQAGQIDNHLKEIFTNCCFKKNPYIFKFENPDFLMSLDFLTPEEKQELVIIRTQKWNYAAVNSQVLFLMENFNGKANIKSIFQGMSQQPGNLQFVIYPIIKEGDETDFYPGAGERIVFSEPFDLPRVILLVKALCLSNLIELVGCNTMDADPDFHQQQIKLKTKTEKEIIQTVEKNNDSNRTYRCQVDAGAKSPVLFLGDRTGPASTGLLYIASFLRRNGIEAYCQWNDTHTTRITLKNNVEKLLSRIHPEIVGVSMKWFPHMARVLEICRLVKSYDPSIIIVVGGNTASYYCDEIIRHDCTDYVIRGDGEIPMLALCRGEDYIPNSVYKEKGKIIKNPITYVQDERNTSGIYLSHLDEIFISKKDPYLASCFFINTGKGCSMQCFYCAGCQEAQIKTFNRKKPFLRGVKEVRRDMIEVKKYTGSFFFDFDLSLYDSLDYYKALWEGLNLSEYFCNFYFWQLPSGEFLDYVVTTFKYVRINIDLCSLSETHRKRLASLQLVKPQPTDQQLFSFFDKCETYDNIEVVINQVTGLPYFTREDIKKSEETLSKLLERYSCLKSMDWGRLHAQPGAPIVQTYEKYDMHCYAAACEDFLKYSQLNMEEDTYPVLLTFNYPYIYFKDDELNSKISKHYYDANKRLEEYEKEMERAKLTVPYHLTYAQLDEKSDQLAKVLINKGVKPGTVVGVRLERSMEMIMAILAILKAGGAYMPIDPDYPEERINYMLADSKVQFLLIDNPSRHFNCQLLMVDEELPGSRRLSNPPKETNNNLQLKGNNLAYILYTSGSTGKPKGVMVEHKNVVRLVKNANYIDLARGNRLLLTGNIVFDITTFEIWGSLLNGLNLYLPDQEVILDGEKLKQVLSENKINILHLVPQVFDQLASLPGGLEIFSGLDYLLVGGDLVRPRYINELRNKFKQLKILHMYGPTENTTFSTCYPVEKPVEDRLPIGKPIGNSCAYVAAIHNPNKLQPVGVVGELLLGGDGVARGYLNNPELTAEKFQISNKPGYHRSYRSYKSYIIYLTGDLARWLPSGDLEFLGRRDQQIKIRGMRIELGEIESRLLDHPRVKEAVIIEKTLASSRDKYLCAYIVPDNGGPVSTTLLKEYLSHSLPVYMVPSYFVEMEKIPLTPNGKIDRKLLPEPGFRASREYTAPRNEIEKKLAGIWREVLGTDKLSGTRSIGIDDNFFELGGHSLKATLLAAKIYKTFNVKLPLTKIFKTPHIRGLSRYITSTAKAKYTAIEHTEEKEYYAPASAQKRLYVMQHLDEKGTTYNIPLLFILEGHLDKDRLEETFKQLINRHESFRTSFETIEGTPVQKIHEDFNFNIEYDDISEVKVKEEQSSCSEGTRGLAPLPIELAASKIKNFFRSFDLSQAPLLRVGLIKLLHTPAALRGHPSQEGKKDQYLLMVDMHHITADGLSSGTVVKEFKTLYNGGKLPEVNLQYKDFSQWQHNLLTSGAIKKQEEYWLNRFKTNIPVLNLPFDYPRPTARHFTGSKISFEIHVALTAKIKELESKTGTTLYMILLTAYYILLAKYGLQEDIVVGSPVTGRKHEELQHLVGMFVNMLPMRNYPRGNKTFREFLYEVKENSIDAFENQDYQFDELVSKLGIERDFNRSPLVETVFTLQNVSDRPDTQEDSRALGLKVKPYEYESNTTMFDLTLDAVESSDCILMWFTYSTRLFKPSTIEKFKNHYIEILEQAVENIDIRLKDIIFSHDLVTTRSTILQEEQGDFQF